MPIEGAIAERTRGIIPVTWDALSKDINRYGDGLLQTAIDTAKESVLGTVPLPAAESDLPLIVIDYIAKVAALQIIPAGRDFWMSESLTVTTRGPDETTTYTDRAEALRRLGEDLLKEVREAEAEISLLVNYTRKRGRSVPAINTLGDPLLTPDPQEFPRPYTATTRS